LSCILLVVAHVGCHTYSEVVVEVGDGGGGGGGGGREK
jgi:hypothetical protein